VELSEKDDRKYWVVEAYYELAKICHTMGNKGMRTRALNSIYRSYYFLGEVNYQACEFFEQVANFCEEVGIIDGAMKFYERKVLILEKIWEDDQLPDPKLIKAREDLERCKRKKEGKEWNKIFGECTS
jgi:hypothetical protein